MIRRLAVLVVPALMSVAFFGPCGSEGKTDPTTVAGEFPDGTVLARTVGPEAAQEAYDATYAAIETRDAPAPTATSAPEATATPPASARTSEASCEHGTGQSIIFLVFRGLDNGEVLSGNMVQTPPQGLISPSQFTITADAGGIGRTQFDIQRFGLYAWIAEDIRGNYTVGAECPGPIE